ncbi:MAG TPA: hypothetical protein VF339_19250 [Gammaproteobacteria bacterium]
MRSTDDIIDLAYCAAVDPKVWPQAVRSMSRRYEAIAAGLYVADFAARRAELISVQGIDPPYVKCYVDDYLCENPWSIDSMQAVGRIRTDTSLDEYHRRPGYYRSTTLFNEWMKPQDFVYTLGVNLTADPIRQTKLFLYRPECAGPYTARDVARFRRLTRHLITAVKVADRFAAARRKANELRHVIDRLRFGVVLLADDGSVLEANAFAARLFERREGLTVIQGQLVAMHRSSGTALTRALRAAIDVHRGVDADAPEPCYLERSNGVQPLSALALPLPKGREPFGVQRAAVALLVTDPVVDVGVPIERLRQRFRLTSSEARLAVALMRGQRLRDAAEQAGLTYETARWYLKSTFQKTGATRQADLVRLLLSEPQLLLPK